jgi:tetratricopeptide (TPR) repeat protein
MNQVKYAQLVIDLLRLDQGLPATEPESANQLRSGCLRIPNLSLFQTAIFKKTRRLVKLRLLTGILVLSIASIAAWLYLRTERKESNLGSLESAHKAADRPISDGQHEKEILKLALEKSPGHAPVLLRLAEIESEDGHLEESAGHLRRILQADPGNQEANLELGKVLFQLGDVRGAIEHTEAILHTHPTYEAALYNMGAIYANIGNKRRALEYLEKIAALHSNSENAKKAQLMLSRLETNNP